MKTSKSIIPTGINERIMSAPPEFWEAAKHYESCDAYAASEKKPLRPCPDKIFLNDALVERLHEIGLLCDPIHPRDAALPVFTVDIMPNANEECSSSLWEIVFPGCNPATDREFSVYGMNLLFSSNDAEICCDISYHYTDHSGGGYEFIGTVGIMADGDYFFSHPYSMSFVAHEEFGMYDYTSITTLCNWLGYLWRGIQHQLIYRPEKIHVMHHRTSQNERQEARKTTSRSHVVKVQRQITILLDDEDSVEISSKGSHQITLSLWSVSGHWRTLKSGKRIWIAPYYKGKDRDKEASEITPKEYRFLKED